MSKEASFAKNVLNAFKNIILNISVPKSDEVLKETI